MYLYRKFWSKTFAERILSPDFKVWT